MPASRTISFNLPEETIEQLNHLADRSGRSRSYIVQQCLELYFENPDSVEPPHGVETGPDQSSSMDSGHS